MTGKPETLEANAVKVCCWHIATDASVLNLHAVVGGIAEVCGRIHAAAVAIPSSRIRTMVAPLPAASMAMPIG